MGKREIVVAVHYENSEVPGIRWCWRLSGERNRKEIGDGYEKYWGEKR